MVAATVPVVGVLHDPSGGNREGEELVSVLYKYIDNNAKVSLTIFEVYFMDREISLSFLLGVQWSAENHPMSFVM